MNESKQTILVTGATGGIGAALARRLHADGARLVLQGRDGERLAALSAELGGVPTMEGDLRNPDDIDRMAAAAAVLGVNVLVNNAGMGEFAIFDVSDIAAVMETNVIGTMRLTQAMLPHLTACSPSLVVNVGSTFGAIGFPGYVSYCASKHAIRGFSEALRRELADTGVDVCYVSPRATRTTMVTKAADEANAALGVGADDADVVATAIARTIAERRPRHQLGRLERLQVRLNSLLPAIVDQAIARQLPVIKKFASQ